MFFKDITRMVAQTPTAPTGLTAATMIETAHGCRRVEALRPGDRLYTMDGGARPILGVERRWLAPGEGGLVHIPHGTFGNTDDLFLPEGQLVLMPADVDDLFPDAPPALVPAVALVGLFGIMHRPVTAPIELFQVQFAHEEVIWGNAGVQLFCPATGRPEAMTESLEFTVLTLTDARHLLMRRRVNRHQLPEAA